MTAYDTLRDQLAAQPRTWLVTGCAGFIGSNLLEALLRLGQTVVGLDNFSTGHQRNLDEVRELVGTEAWQRFRFIQGDDSPAYAAAVYLSRACLPGLVQRGRTPANPAAAGRWPR